MFDLLFKRPATVRRHLEAPYAQERQQYLAAQARQGNTHSTLQFTAQDLLWIACKLSIYLDLRTVTMEQVRALADDWKKRERACGRLLNKAFTRQRYLRLAASWLRFLGHLHASAQPIPFEPRLQEYCHRAREERGLSEATVKQFSSQIRHFLRWYGTLGRDLADVQVGDVDTYLAHGGCRSPKLRRSLGLTHVTCYAALCILFISNAFLILARDSTPPFPLPDASRRVLRQMRATGGHSTARAPLPMQSSGLEACVEGLEEPGRHFAATLYRC